MMFIIGFVNSNHRDNIIIPPGCSPWPHEQRAVRILANIGIKCVFIPEVNTAKTPDVLIENRQYEIKSPISSKIESVERNLKRAVQKSRYIIFDSSRMRRLSDKLIENELIKQLHAQSVIQEIIFVDKSANVKYLTRKK